MNPDQYVARFMVHKVGNFGLKERALCFGESSFATFDLDTQAITNSWSYDEVESTGVVEGEESDFFILTPRHRVKKTVYRCNYRMEVLVCLMRLRSHFQAHIPGRPVAPELQIHNFQGTKFHKQGLESPCVIEICPDGVYQKDTEGDVMSHIPYTSLVSLDLICDNHDAILLNHSDNSSLFLVKNRTELARRILQVMESYGMRIYEYRKKTMEAACRDETGTSFAESLSIQFQVLKVSLRQKPSATRTLSISEKFITEYRNQDTVISSRPLTRVYGLVLPQDSTDGFEVIFVDGVRRVYFSEYREKIVAEILSSCHALNNTQVDVVAIRAPEWIRMLPRKIIQLEGSKLVSKAPDVNVLDRELRVCQSAIIQRFAALGAKRAQRIRRDGADEELHRLALELNLNTPTSGIIAQPNKPFDKVVFLLMHEMRDITNQFGAKHEFISTYLQSLFRLLQAPPAMTEFVNLLEEHADDYIPTICAVMMCRQSVTVYWVLSLLKRVLDAKAQKFRLREILLSKKPFLSSLLSLFDPDPQSKLFLSDLPTMKLCQLVLVLVRVNPDNQSKLSMALYRQLSLKYRMFIRILFGFPALGTVEACVGILSRMTKSPQMFRFDEEPTDGESSHHERLNMQHGSSIMRRQSASSVSSIGSSSLLGVDLRNPSQLLKQYKLFIESPCGPQKKNLLQYTESVYLRLRYRCRNIFLQELVSHTVGQFDEFKRLFVVEYYRFPGFLGKENGQREKSELYLTPRALVAVRTINKHTHELEYRSIQSIVQATSYPDAFTITVKDKLKYVYSEQSSQIVQKMKLLAGMIGIHLQVAHAEELPKQGKRDVSLTEVDADTRAVTARFDVTKRSERHGLWQLRKKTVIMAQAGVEEVDDYSRKLYRLQDIRHLCLLSQTKMNGTPCVGLQLKDGKRIIYMTDSAKHLLSVLYDGCRHAENWNVSISEAFTDMNPRLTLRALLHDDYERYFYLNHEGFFIPSYQELSREIKKLSSDGIAATSGAERVSFALETMNVNVEVGDFSFKVLEKRLPHMDFSMILQGMMALLEQACKSPVRVNDLATVLCAFCRINDGCYKFSSLKDFNAEVFTEVCVRAIESGNEIAMTWAICTIHSLVLDKTRTSSHKSLEKKVRLQILEHSSLLQLLVDSLSDERWLPSVATLQLMVDVLIVSRGSTDNNQFDTILRMLGMKQLVLLQFAQQRANVGLAVNAICLLKAVMRSGGQRVRELISDTALEHGIVINDLYYGLFHESEAGREMHQYICELWMAQHRPSYELLARILPRGFIRMVTTSLAKKMIQNELATQRGGTQGDLTPEEPFIYRMKNAVKLFVSSDHPSRNKGKHEDNRTDMVDDASGDLRLLGKLVSMDFELPDVIWNAETRQELKRALENAIRSFRTFVQPDDLVVWNHRQFKVEYQSLAGEVKVGSYYLRVLLQKIQDVSLSLSNVSKILDETESSKNHDRYKKLLVSGSAGHLFLATMDIARAPAVFFGDVYQCWLEELHLSTFPLFGDVSETTMKRPGSCFFSVAADVDEGGDAMLKMLVEVMRAFPSVRVLPCNRARFLIQLLKNSCVHEEIQDVLELVSLSSTSYETTRHFSSENDMLMLLYLATLGHRIGESVDTDYEKQIEDDDDDDVPMMELKPVPEDRSVSSFPITHHSFTKRSRFHLRWRVRHTSSGSDGGTVAGPFLAIELRKYLANSAACRQQGSAVYLCCCSLHDDEESADHTWKSFFEFPELRWMELTNHPLDCQAVALNALWTVRNIVLNEVPSLGTAHKMWPVPIAKRILSEQRAIMLLAQLLVVKQPSIRKLVCEILLAVDESALKRAFKYGVFFFLFASDINDEASKGFVAESHLLKRIHRIQDCFECRPAQSFLVDILPEALIRVLDAEPPEAFAAVFTCKRIDKRVLWSPTMTSHLRSMVLEHTAAFREELEWDCGVTYQYVSLPPVKYSELSRDVYCSGYFLSTLADTNCDGQGDGSLDMIEEPLLLMAAIDEKWRRRSLGSATTSQEHASLNVAGALELFGWNDGMSFTLADLRERYRELSKKGVEIATLRAAYDVLSSHVEKDDESMAKQNEEEMLLNILQVQLRLLEKFPLQFSSYECSTLDLLVGLLNDKLMENQLSNPSKTQEFKSMAALILHKMLVCAPQNVSALLQVEGCWKPLLLFIKQRTASSTDVETNRWMIEMLKTILATKEGINSIAAGCASGKDRDSINSPSSISLNLADAQVSTVASEICTFVDHTLRITSNPPSHQVQKLLFEITVLLCRSQELQQHLVNSTRLFWKALATILQVGGKIAHNPAEIHAERELLDSAFLALRALACGRDGKHRSNGFSALQKLLPREFMDCFEKPTGHDFCTIIFSDVREPTCIWNEDTRQELMELAEEYCAVDDDDAMLLPSLLESAASHSYDALSSEPCVGGIYLHVLLEKADDNPQAVNEATFQPHGITRFLESIFQFLEQNRNPRLGIYSETLPALECLHVLADIPITQRALIGCLERHVNDGTAVSVSTLGDYLLPFDPKANANLVSISSRRSLSAYGFKSRNNQGDFDLDEETATLEAEFGNVDYRMRQEFALDILLKICEFECDLEHVLKPFCKYTWSLQVLADHLDSEQAYYALYCLAELCDVCVEVARYVEQSGLWVEILGLAIQSRQHVLHEQFVRAEALRAPAFEVLNALLKQEFSVREALFTGLSRFLPYPMIYQIDSHPSTASKFFEDDHEKSDLIWNARWRRIVRNKVDEIIYRNRVERSKIKRDSVVLDDLTDFVQFPENFKAGMYLDRFLTRPDPEKLTNPVYNLEQLYRLWRMRLDELMAFDIGNPPPNLKSRIDEVQKLTTAILHILRCPLDIEDGINHIQLPDQILQLVRYSNKHFVASFPYRCMLKLARQLVSFPELQSCEFLELLFCRMAVQHPDTPALMKLVRRILEYRSATFSDQVDPAFWLRDVKYYPKVVTFLEKLVHKKQDLDSRVLSNVHRILRLVKAEQDLLKDKEDNRRSITQSFLGRYSARWQNFTLAESKADQKEQAETKKNKKLMNRDSSSSDASDGSFDVDDERETGEIRSTDTFDVDEERAKLLVRPPPASFTLDFEDLEEEEPEASPPPSPVAVPPVSNGAHYRTIDSNYHSHKTAEYELTDRRFHEDQRSSLPDIHMLRMDDLEFHDGDAPPASRCRLGSLPDARVLQNPSHSVSIHSRSASSQRLSLLEPWRASTSNKPYQPVTSIAISRRGRRATAMHSRRKSKAPKWSFFGR